MTPTLDFEYNGEVGGEMGSDLNFDTASQSSRGF